MSVLIKKQNIYIDLYAFVLFFEKKTISCVAKDSDVEYRLTNLWENA